MPYKRGKTFAEKSAEKKKEPEKKLTPARRLKSCAVPEESCGIQRINEYAKEYRNQMMKGVKP